MPVLPHNFPTLRLRGSGNHRPSVLILGAGMSYGLVPLPGPLLAEKRANAESSLGCTSAVPTVANPTPDHLYEWADDIRRQLIARGDPNSKLTLAESLDIPKEDRWLGCISTQRNTPRHRVIARFARERLWDQIWSLNWDCVQESALENVGIKRRAFDAQMPWPTVFNTFITAAECAQMGEPNSVKILKPHGCVMALVEAREARDRGNQPDSIARSERFLITATELKDLDPAISATPAQDFIFSSLCTKLSSLPFVVAGWSVSEKYLTDYIGNHVSPFLLNPNRQPPLAPDELSIVDRQFNAHGHELLASYYGRDASTTHIDVGHPNLGLDAFFLWLQALYAVGCLQLRALAADRAALDEVAAAIDQPPDTPNFTIGWVDDFLPVWVRLCWRWGMVPCESQNAKPVEIDDVALEMPDEHIPWTLPNIPRPELRTATRLLAALHRSGHGSNWNFEKFPGGFYRDFQLVIPIPVWASGPPNDLRALKALIDAIKKPGAGYIDRMALVFVGPDPTQVIPDDTKRILKQLVASYLAMARFANAGDIEDIRLEDL